MRAAVIASLLAVLSFGSVRSWASGALYASDAGTQQLYTLNPTTAARKYVGSFGVSGAMAAMAYDSGHDVLYGANTATNNLYSISRATGAASLIGPLGVSSMHGLAFDPRTGILYGCTGGSISPALVDSSLYTVNPSTGQATLIGDMGIPGVGGLAFRPNTDVLYGIVCGHYSSPAIVSIDMATGHATTVVYTQPSYLEDLSFDPQTGDLYAIDNGGFDYHSNLYKIDITTGAATNIGLTGLRNGLGLIYTPEPATLSLLALGGLLVARRRAARVLPVFLAAGLLAGFANPASADVLNMGGTRNADGSWNGLASLETVPVGNPGNPADPRYVPSDSKGSVAYEYRIGKYEVTAGQYCEFLNKVAGVDTYGLYHTEMWSGIYLQSGCKIERFAGSGTTGDPYQYRVAADYANRPVNYVDFGDACRFANWLHNNQPSGLQNDGTTEDGAYTLNGATDDATLMAVTRRSGWQWAITSLDEWYKAGYYDPASGSYYDYPTSSNSAPSNELLMPDGGNNATFYVGVGIYTIGSPYWRTVVGEFELSASPYGTFDQGGNVFEWNEAVVSGGYRSFRGGWSGGDLGWLRATVGSGGHPSNTYYGMVGFRVVQVPEPATLSLLALGGLLIARRRA